MTQLIEISVPDIGNFADVDVIEVLVQPGQAVDAEESLITLESEKATMEIPSPAAGTIASLKVKVGDKVSQGHIIATMETADEKAAEPEKPAEATPGAASVAAATPSPAAGGGEQHFDVLVLGSGPGGYTAAFRAADLGKKVVLVERHATLGGVCLNVGCIPSKALLHVAKVITEAKEMADHGVSFGEPQIDLDKTRAFKAGVVQRLTQGLAQLAKQRGVTVIRGTGRFAAPHHLAIATEGGDVTVSFDHAIIAAGSEAVRLPNLPDDPRIMSSTGALALADVPKRLLVIGGGIIGLEMATVYAALGSEITIVELSKSLIPGCDADLVRPLSKRIQKSCRVLLGTKVESVETLADDLRVRFEGQDTPERFNRILVAVGRRPNGKAIAAEAAGVRVDERGFIPVDREQRTNVQHIFAIGDIVGHPMLAHKAVHEGKVAAEVIAGHKASFDALAIPSVAYTDPEVAWMGLTETEAKEKGIEYEKAAFPWAASGRALSLGRDDGLTKLLVDPKTRRILGAGIVGVGAGDLIAEAVLALEMGADTEDLALTIHPHPTLSETLGFAAEVAEGSITDLFLGKKR